MLTPKENYLKILHGETPEWVPSYTLGAPNPDQVRDIPSILFENPWKQSCPPLSCLSSNSDCFKLSFELFELFSIWSCQIPPVTARKKTEGVRKVRMQVD